MAIINFYKCINFCLISRSHTPSYIISVCMGSENKIMLRDIIITGISDLRVLRVAAGIL